MIGQDGQRYGPVDLTTLNNWVTEQRVTDRTWLEEAETGRRLLSTEVPGLVLVQSAPEPPSAPFQSPYGEPQQGSPYPRGYPYGQDNGQGDLTKSFVFSALGFLCCPVVFSVLGIIFANKAKEKGHPQSQTAFVLAIVSLVVGALVGVGFGIGR